MRAFEDAAELKSDISNEDMIMSELGTAIAEEEDALGGEPQGFTLSRAFEEAKAAIRHRVSEFVAALSLKRHWHAGVLEEDQEQLEEIQARQDLHLRAELV